MDFNVQMVFLGVGIALSVVALLVILAHVRVRAHEREQAQADRVAREVIEEMFARYLRGFSIREAELIRNMRVWRQAYLGKLKQAATETESEELELWQQPRDR